MFESVNRCYREMKTFLMSCVFCELGKLMSPLLEVYEVLVFSAFCCLI